MTFLQKILFRGCVLTLMLATLPLAAQTNAPKVLHERFLFVVDTSAAMKRRSKAVEKAVENLMRSSMAAQLQEGDTVGVWTFNEQLSAGKFPLLVWSPERTDFAASNIVAFLKAQKYEKESKFDVAMSALNRVIQDSYRLTILLITDGSQRITGTPYDGKIAAAFSQNFKAQEKARMPFITVLRSSRGRFVNGGVTLAPWPVEFRDFPPEPVVTAAPPPKPQAEVKPPVRKTLPPLIIKGKKPDPVAAPTTPPPAPATNSPAPAGASITAPVVTPETNGLPTADPNLIVITALPKPDTNATAKTTAPTPPPVITPTPPQISLSEIKPGPASQTSLVETNAKTTVAVVAPTNTLAAPPVAEAKSLPATVTVAKPAPLAPANSNPIAPATAATPSTEHATSAVSVASAPPTAPAHPSTTVAVVTNTEPGFNRIWIIAAAGGLLLLAGGLFLVTQRRSRRTQQISLITSSMDRGSK